jgi:hypothetical protein
MRRRPASDALFVVAGIWALVVAVARLGNNNHYPPTDLRSQPWFDPAISAIFILIGLFLITVGVIRIARARRERHQ